MSRPTCWKAARLRLRPGVFPEAEASGLQTINPPLASEFRVKRDAWLREQAQRQLSEEEQATLAELIDAVEMANAQRWQALAALTQGERKL